MELDQRKQRKKGFLAGFIICIFFAVVFFCLTIFSSPTVIAINDTEEYLGTLKEVEKVDQDYLISLHEYAFKLLIDHKTVIDDEALSIINEGENIFFRLYTGEMEKLLQGYLSDQIIPFSLRTDKTDIITLDSYNADIENFANTSRITFGCIFGVTFLLSFIFLYKYIKRTKESKKNKDSKRSQNSLN